MPRVILAWFASTRSPSWSAAGARWRAALGAMVAGALASSCGTPASREAAPGSTSLYIGSLDGGDAKVAVVRDGSRWATYVCGGRDTLSSMTAWFQGSLDSSRDTTAFEASAEGKELRASLTLDSVSGTLTVDGAATRFVTSRVSNSSPAGLFQSASGGCRTGLIVPPAGQGEPQGVYCADLRAAGKPTVRIFEQVNPVEPVTSAEDVVAARVTGDSAQILYLAPVSLPLE